MITAGAFIPNGHWPAEYDGGYLLRRCRQRQHVAAPGERIDQLRGAVRHRRSGALPTWPSSSTRQRSSLYYIAQQWRRPQDHPRDDAVHRAGRAVVPRSIRTGKPRARHPPRRVRQQAGARRRPRAYVPTGCRPGGHQGGAGQRRVRHAEHLGLSHRVGRQAVRGHWRRTSTPSRARSCANSAVVPGRCQRRDLARTPSRPRTSSSTCSAYFDVAPGAVERRPLRRRVTESHRRHARRRCRSTNQFTRRRRHVPDRQRSRCRARWAARRGTRCGRARGDCSDRSRRTAAGSSAPVPAVQAFSGSSNLNTNGLGDIRANLVVVPLGADGSRRLPSAVGSRCGRRCRRLLHVVERAVIDGRSLPRRSNRSAKSTPVKASASAALPGEATSHDRSRQRARQRTGDGPQHHDRRQRVRRLRLAVPRRVAAARQRRQHHARRARSTRCCRSPNSARHRRR